MLIDFLSDDAAVRQASNDWLKREQERAAKRERVKRLLQDINKTKAMAGYAKNRHYW